MMVDLPYGADDRDATTETPVELVALTYHTIDHALEYLEGDHYTTNLKAVISTVVGCGFAAIVPAAPPP